MIRENFKNKLRCIRSIGVKFLFRLFLIISILAIILVKFTPFQSLPEPAWFPYGNQFIEVVFNLSIGYIVSSLFYLVVVYLPQEIKKQSAMKIIQARLNTIRYMMEPSVNYFYLRMNTTMPFDDLTEHDFEQFAGLDAIPMNLRYMRKSKSTGQWEAPMHTGQQTEIEYFLHEQKVVTEKITQIFGIPTTINVDHELIEILSELRDCWFYAGIATLISFNLKPIIINFNKGVFHYYELFKKLRKYTDGYEWNFEIVSLSARRT